MILGVGVDIVENERMRKNVGNTAFLERIFSDDEIAYLNKKARKTEALSAHYAVKEAFFKAVGTGIAEGLGFKDIVIAHEENGRPFITHNEKVDAYLKKKFPCKTITTHLSLSHETTYSVAIAIIASP